MEYSRYNEAPYLENPNPAIDARTPYPPSGSNDRVVYVERRKRRRKCCFCFPLVPGVYILIIMNLISGLFSILLGGLGLGTGILTFVFAIILAYGVAAVLALSMGLVGLYKWKPKVYAAAPFFMVFSLVMNIINSLLLFLLPKEGRHYPRKFSPIEPTYDGEEKAAMLAISAGCGFVFNFFIGIYYSYVMIRLYKVMKKEPKN